MVNFERRDVVQPQTVDDGRHADLRLALQVLQLRHQVEAGENWHDVVLNVIISEDVLKAVNCAEKCGAYLQNFATANGVDVVAYEDLEAQAGPARVGELCQVSVDLFELADLLVLTLHVIPQKLIYIILTK